MKRFAAVAISLLLILSGCGLKGSEASDGVSGEISDGVSEEESAEISFPPIPVPEHPRVLIGTPVWLNETDFVEPDFDAMASLNDLNADLVGTSMTVEVCGIQFTGEYEITISTSGSRPGRHLRYRSPNGSFLFGINAENKQLIRLYVLADLLPEEMREKWMSSDTMPDIEELKEKSLRFMETYSALDSSEWEEQVRFRQEPYYSDRIDEYIGGFKLVFHRIKKDIVTSFISFEYDRFGNLILYSTSGLLYECEKVNIPDWPDEVYVEATLERLRDIYSADEHVVDIKAQDPPFTGKDLSYVQPFDVYAISYTMYYTVIYDDGTERNDAHTFKFVIPEWE